MFTSKNTAKAKRRQKRKQEKITPQFLQLKSILFTFIERKKKKLVKRRRVKITIKTVFHFVDMTGENFVDIGKKSWKWRSWDHSHPTTVAFISIRGAKKDDTSSCVLTAPVILLPYLIWRPDIKSWESQDHREICLLAKEQITFVFLAQQWEIFRLIMIIFSRTFKHFEYWEKDLFCFHMRLVNIRKKNHESWS